MVDKDDECNQGPIILRANGGTCPALINYRAQKFSLFQAVFKKMAGLNVPYFGEKISKFNFLCLIDF